MANCQDCIHKNVCHALIKDGLPWNDGKYPAEAFCMTFRNKADFAEIVRCKDCKYHRDLDGGVKCERMDGLLMTLPNDFCSYGKKKGGAE